MAINLSGISLTSDVTGGGGVSGGVTAKMKFIPVTTLPSADEARKNAVYLLPSKNTTSNNKYDEYVVLQTENGYIWEPFGQDVSVDLQSFATKTDLAKKQDKLVNQQNIRSVNNVPLIGAGNVNFEVFASTAEHKKVTDFVDNAPNVYATKEYVDEHAGGTVGIEDTEDVEASVEESVMQMYGEAIENINVLSTLNAEEIEREKYRRMYLTIEALENSTFYVQNQVANAITRNTDLQYSLDGGATWTSYAVPTGTAAGATIQLPKGTKMLLKGNNPEGFNFETCVPKPEGEYGINLTRTIVHKFLGTGSTSVYGNVFSLHFGDEFYGKKEEACDGCFGELFKGNLSVVDAKNLVFEFSNMKTMACFSMLMNCTNLKNTPKLSCDYVSMAGYGQMFYSCTKLEEVQPLHVTRSEHSAFLNMFNRANMIPRVYVKSAGCQAFNNFAYGNATNIIDEFRVKGASRLGLLYTFYKCTNLVDASNVVISGVGYESCFQMFCDCTSLVVPPKLVASDLDYRCYAQMFLRCTALENAPALPALTCAEECYRAMFQDCTSLVVPPKLVASDLDYGCYWQMFWKCTALENAPELPATILAKNCYMEMFRGCTSLETAPELPATRLATECYVNMFQGCTSLVNAPELPATTLSEHCYSNMFRECTSLVNAPALPATRLAMRCYLSMFHTCTSLVNAPALPAQELAPACYAYMFRNCTNLASADTIGANILTDEMDSGDYDLNYMFDGCTKLNSVKVMFVKYNELALKDWLKNVSSTGTFVMADDAEWNPEDHRGANGVPEGWTIERVAREKSIEEKVEDLDLKVGNIDAVLSNIIGE